MTKYAMEPMSAVSASNIPKIEAPRFREMIILNPQYFSLFLEETTNSLI